MSGFYLPYFINEFASEKVQRAKREKELADLVYCTSKSLKKQPIIWLAKLAQVWISFGKLNQQKSLYFAAILLLS